MQIAPVADVGEVKDRGTGIQYIEYMTIWFAFMRRA